MEVNPLTVAKIQTPDSLKDIKIKEAIGKFTSIAEAEQAAKKTADADQTDAVIIQEEGFFHVYGIDELHPNLPINSPARLKAEAFVISFVSTDPLSGKENFIGKQPEGTINPEIPKEKTAIDEYRTKFSDQLTNVLGNEKEAFLTEISQLEKNIDQQGIKLKIELDDDVFENKDKLQGYKNFLTYIGNNAEALSERNIKNISIVDEADNWWGVKTDLEYDSASNEQTLAIGDDFLDDWGESLELFPKESIQKIEKAIGEKLTPEELQKKQELGQKLTNKLAETYNKLNQLQNDLLQNNQPQAIKPELEKTLRDLEKLAQSLTETKVFFGDLSVKNQAKIALKELEKFSGSLKQINDQLKSLLKAENNPDQITMAAGMEKIKIFLLKGTKEVPDNRNSFSGYLSGTFNGRPGAGLNYSHAFDEEKATILDVNLGTSTMNANNDILLGLGIGHNFSTKNKVLNGLYAGVGIGVGIDTPLFSGVSLNNSWYLNNYQTRQEDLSVVGGAYASLGSFNNIGAYTDLHRQLSEKIEWEGSGEISLLNQNLEAELEYSLDKNKNIYLTGGIGTNKLVYAGIGFAGKYELEAGLGGISFGKDSDNLPGETSWEIGLRSYLPIPYFKHHKVPGYQFTYADESKEYVTPKGTFMTIKGDQDKQRISYLPDPLEKDQTPKMTYTICKSGEEKQEKREISVSSLGYLTVKDGEKTLIDDGFILGKMSQAELGIATDQASVLWFDKLQKGNEPSMASRRKELPLPLFRAVHQ